MRKAQIQVQLLDGHITVPLMGGFLSIDDLSTKAWGDTLDCFNVTVHKLPNSQSPLDISAEFDTAAIEGFAICIQPAPSLPPIIPDFTMYLVSASGPIVPTPFNLSLSSIRMMTWLPLITACTLPSPSAQITACEWTLSHSLVSISANRTFLDTLPISPSPSDDISKTAAQVFKYKPVAKKVQPVAATLPEEFRATRQIIGDPLAGMPMLSPTLPDFTPTGCYNNEACDIVNANHSGDFLLPEEWKLMHHFMSVFEWGFAWNKRQKGRFCDDFFPLIKIPVIPHVPWALRNIPILPSIYNDVLKIIRDKIASGMYEPSSLSYRSRWFMVLKKNDKLRIVHDLQPLNVITIQDSAMPLFTEQLAELFGGWSCFGLLDLFIGYDEQMIHTDSHDLTTFPMPFGAYWLTSVPMGWANAVSAFHADVTFTFVMEWH